MPIWLSYALLVALLLCASADRVSAQDAEEGASPPPASPEGTTTTAETEAPPVAASSEAAPSDPSAAPGTTSPPAQAWDYLDGPSGAPTGGSDDELAALGLGADDADETFPKLSLYGFMDFTAWYPLISKKWEFYFPTNSTFWMGNINVYFASQMSRTLRSLLEVRFTYLPNGKNRSSLETQSQPYVDTTTSDYTDAERPIKLGAIEIERVHLDYAPSELFALTVGQWLTPYGVWNVEHGSPTTIMAHKPYVVGEQYLPERQTGLLVQGTWRHGAHRLGYGAGISNGRGPLESYYDMDSNKGLTGRLYWTRLGARGDLTLGASIYHGRFTNAQRAIGVKPGKQSGTLELDSTTTIKEQYDELALAADAQWVWGGLRVISEFALNRRSYTDRGRPQIGGLITIIDPGGGTRVQPDDTSMGGYVIGGYRFDWFGVMPFVQMEYVDIADKVITATASVTGGLNIRPHEAVTLKAHFGYGWFPGADKRGPGTDPVRALESQLAWAF